jgi:hypothetical protein
MLHNNMRLLSALLVVMGAAFCGLYAMLIIWPSGWAWHQGSPASNDYFMMIAGVYATLGIFMIRAARDPLANASLVWFAAASSIVHALVMGWEALRNPMMHGHLVGDVPIVLVAGILLGILMGRAESRAATAAA